MKLLKKIKHHFFFFSIIAFKKKSLGLNYTPYNFNTTALTNNI